MRLTLISVGKSTEAFVQQACDLYAQRIRRYLALHLVTVPEERVSSGKREHILRQEARRLREKIPSGDFLIALAEEGKFFGSRDFAGAMAGWSSSGNKGITFLVGGPYGLEESLKAEADLRLSLSPMTLPHGLAKVILLEQIYRGLTILKGEPYHKA